jgi:hypothetical protein
MNFRSTLVLLLAVAAVPACSKKPAADKGAPATGSDSDITVTVTTGSGSAAPAGSAAVAAHPGDSKPFEATMEGKPYKFVGARVQNGNAQDTIVLTSAAGGCAHNYTAGDIELQVNLEQGPGGKHFAGSPLGLYTGLTSETTKFAAGQLESYVTTEPGEWKVGNKIKGTLRFSDGDGFGSDMKLYDGSGSFEAEICAVASDPFEAPPDKVDATPAAGNMGEQKFGFRGGIAFLAKNKRDVDNINRIWLFDAPVTCDNYKQVEDKKAALLMINGDGGSTAKDLLPGTFQQRGFSYRTPDGAQHFINGPAWIKFDTIELKEGGDVKGSLYVATSASDNKAHPKDVSKVAGTFAVKVCAD